MSLAQAVRGALSGGNKPAMAADDTDDEDVIDANAAEDSDEPDAADDQPDDDAEDDRPDDDAEGDEPDDDDTMSAADRRAFAQGRRAGVTAERTRIAAILGDKSAEANPGLAAHLAFNTSMSADDALSAVKAGGAPQAKGRLRNRVANADGQKPLGNGGKNAAQPQSTADRRAAARAGYLAGMSNRKKKEA